MRSDFGEQKSFRYRGTKKFPIPGNKKVSDTGTRTRVSCVRGKYANHLHHIGICVVNGIALIYNTYLKFKQNIRLGSVRNG